MIVIFTETESNTPEANSYKNWEEFMLYHDIGLLDANILFAWSENGFTGVIRLVSRDELEEWFKGSRIEAKEEIDNENFERRIC